MASFLSAKMKHQRPSSPNYTGMKVIFLSGSLINLLWRWSPSLGGSIPPYINYNFEYVMLRRYKTIIPACYKCGTVGYWVDNCPYPETGPCHQCGKTMADASSAGAQHECLPTCLICGDGHLTGSTTCKGKFRPAQKSARPPRQQLDRGQQKPQYGNRGKSPPENSNAGARPWNRQKQPRKQQTSETVTPEELPSMMPGEFPALE